MYYIIYSNIDETHCIMDPYNFCMLLSIFESFSLSSLYIIHTSLESGGVGAGGGFIAVTVTV